MAKKTVLTLRPGEAKLIAGHTRQHWHDMERPTFTRDELAPGRIGRFIAIAKDRSLPLEERQQAIKDAQLVLDSALKALKA